MSIPTRNIVISADGAQGTDGIMYSTYSVGSGWGGGSNGSNGRDASSPTHGQHAGDISVTLSRSHIPFNIHVQGEKCGIPIDSEITPEHFIVLSACGGNGGAGGHGEGGGNGANGGNGRDATQWNAGGVS
jgi:hypothetical protein